MIIAEYTPSDGCQNQKETWDMLCVKCGKCGRIFNEEGILVKRPPTCHEILDTLIVHYKECDDFRKKLVENDADWFLVKTALTRVSEVDECINLVRSVMEEGNE